MAKVSIINLSRHGRVFVLKGGKNLLPLEVADVEEEDAKFLLGSGPSGRRRFPELVDASKHRDAGEAAKSLADENAKLAAENAALKAKLAASDKGGKK